MQKISYVFFGFIFTAILSIFCFSLPSFGCSESDQSTCSAEQKAAFSSGKPFDVTYRSTVRQANLGDYGSFSPVTSVGSLGNKILKLLLFLLGGIGLLGIIIGGGMMMFGGMDESMLDRGKEIIIYSLIGVAVALLAMAITTLVQTVFYSVDTGA